MQKKTMPTSKQKELEPSMETVRIHFNVSKELLEDLHDLAHSKGISLSKMLLAIAQQEVDENIVKIAVYRHNKKQ